MSDATLLAPVRLTLELALASTVVLIVLGTPLAWWLARTRSALRPLVEATKADEVMITTMIFDHAARKRSYTLLAQAAKD